MEDALTLEKDLPLILGRPFMRMAKTIINVYEGTLTMSMNEETKKFNVLMLLSFLTRRVLVFLYIS